MTEITISNISGETLPINVYISDVYGNNQYLLGAINSTVPPSVVYTSEIPSVFDTAPEIKVTLIDGSNCEITRAIICVT